MRNDELRHLKYITILEKHGFETIQWWYETAYDITELVVQFYGEEFDLIRAYEICELYKLNPTVVRRVYQKESVNKYNEDVINPKVIGECWVKPLNEISFGF